MIDTVMPATFYRSVGEEREVFRAAARRGSPILLKGPTGCGKTRFVEAMAEELGRELITVAGHEDMTSADLAGRFLLKGGDTVWVDGPLTRAVRTGAVFYLDEIVEARKDVAVVLFINTSVTGPEAKAYNDIFKDLWQHAEALKAQAR